MKVALAVCALLSLAPSASAAALRAGPDISEALPPLVVDDSAPLLTQALVDEINSRGTSSSVLTGTDINDDDSSATVQKRPLWTASAENGRLVTGASRAQIRRLLGTRPDDGRLVSADGAVPLPDRVFTAAELAEPIPESFDAAERWPECETIRHIWDQSNCGSCWAVGAASAISDRLCTAGPPAKRRVQFVSARQITSCCTGKCGDGCDGGYAVEAWAYWVSNGLIGEDCQPYPFPKCGHSPNSQYPPCSASSPYPTPKCLDSCDGTKPSPFNNYSFVSYGNHSYRVREEENLQRELMTHGPFETTFVVFADFIGYRSGVYKSNYKDWQGSHAVRVVGWGVLDGVKYWKVANSWNEDWGDKGYFLILRGTNECSMEQLGVGGVPK